MRLRTDAGEMIAYAPDTWNDAQRTFHEPATLEDAMHAASCLAGGWYRRPVRIDGTVTPTNDERYSLRPAEVPTPAGWRPYYTITAHEDA